MTTACGSASPETAGSSEVKVITESGHSKANETGTTEVKTDSKDTSEPDISVWYPYWDNATADKVHINDYPREKIRTKNPQMSFPLGI